MSCELYESAPAGFFEGGSPVQPSGTCFRGRNDAALMHQRGVQMNHVSENAPRGHVPQIVHEMPIEIAHVQPADHSAALETLVRRNQLVTPAPCCALTQLRVLSALIQVQVRRRSVAGLD
jgi:hypothetical protein